MALMIDPKKTALVVIDLQRGIVANPSAPRPGSEVVARAAQMAAAMRAAGGTVVLVHVTPLAGDIVITKRQWGAFYGTELDLQLRRRGVDTIVLCGISTNIGVETTARDAFERGYQQVFVEDAMAARSGEEHTATVSTLFPRIGRVRATDEVVAALG